MNSVSHTTSEYLLKAKLILACKGFCMGAADVIPGVSGGTMAFILGIYAELIAAIRSFDRAWLLSILRLDWRSALTKAHFGFLLPLAAGVLAALLFFTRVIPLPGLLLQYPEQIYGLFFGLISGSIYVLMQDMKNSGARQYIFILPGLIAGLVVINLVPTHTPEAAWFVFLSGALAVCAMVLPGISGSFVLVILNKYAYIFDAIGYFRLSIVAPFALGALTGLVLFTRVISWLLHSYYRNTILFIIGLLSASLYVIWPFQERVYEIVRDKPRLVASTPTWPGELSQTVLLSLALAAAGLIVVLVLNRISRSKEF